MEWHRAHFSANKDFPLSSFASSARKDSGAATENTNSEMTSAMWALADVVRDAGLQLLGSMVI